jgi:uncharacterized phiE125 gp8 family phage protein
VPIPAGPVTDQLVSASDVRQHLNLTDSTQDAELEGFTRAAQAVIENITGPILPRSVTETFDGGQRSIVLSVYPVLTISSITENTTGTAYPLTEITAPYSDTTGYSYRVDYSIGEITRWSGTFPMNWAKGFGTVTVTYTAGRAQVPEDIRLATLRLIEHMWSSQQGGSRRGTSNDVPGAGHVMPWYVEELLAPHRKAPAIA